MKTLNKYELKILKCRESLYATICVYSLIPKLCRLINPIVRGTISNNLNAKTIRIVDNELRKKHQISTVMNDNKTISFKIVSKEEFFEMFVNSVINDHSEYSKEDLIRQISESGFVKLDFQELNKSLNAHFQCFKPIAVDFGDRDYLWLVCGNKAILIDKE